MRTHPNPLGAAVEDLQRGRITPTASVDACLDRFETTEDEIHAFVTEPGRRHRLHEAARALDETDRDDRPPLYGVPVGVKDIYHVDGMETRAGSTVPPEALAGPQADAVTALLEAGAIVFGKTVTAEFAYFDPGPTRNPHDLDHTPGGSSSGSAAAVAAGVVPLALGTQTMGSVARPAAFCGIVGVKPSFDRIPVGGVLPVSTSADHAGYFTQDVAGARLAASVLVDDWAPTDPDTRPALGVPADSYVSQADDTAVAHFERRLETLRTTGYEVRELAVPADVEGVNDRHEDMVAAEAALAHTERFAAYGDRYADATVDLLTDGRETSIGRLVDARNARYDLRDELHDAMDAQGVDVLVTPSAPGPAPEGLESTGDPIMNVPWTHAGVPTVSLPAGTIDGLPVGLQFVGRFGGDERLLAWSASLEDVVGGD